MKTCNIHLIRHGCVKENTEWKYIGHTDSKLSAEGISQLEEMKKNRIYPYADIIFSSPLSRCTDTAKILYPDSKIITVDELIEYNFGEFEGRTADELHEKEPLFDDWLRGDKDIAPPFGETNAEFGQRVCKAFTLICNAALGSEDYDDVAIVTHGGVIMAVMSAFALPSAPMHEWLTPNGCGYTLRLDPLIWNGGQKAEAVREIPFVPINDENYYDGWDYYPDPDKEDFDVSEYIDE